MNNNELKRIEERLIPPAAPEPPEGLLESIQNEIPDHLHLVEERSESTLSPRRLRLIAASMAVVVLGGFLAFKVWREPMYSMRPLDSREAPSGRTVTETAPVDRALSMETDGKASTPSPPNEPRILEEVTSEKAKIETQPVVGAYIAYYVKSL